MFHGVPNPGTLVVPTTLHPMLGYGCVVLYVSRQCAEPLDACTSHPKKTSSLGDRSIYDFHYNIHSPMHALHYDRPKPAIA